LLVVAFPRWLLFVIGSGAGGGRVIGILGGGGGGC
jgi:hypothetical protein